jgi:O-antigen/teichoic acid export membrane protein
MMIARLFAARWGASRVAKVSQVVVANGFNNLASLAITLHAARKLGPERFGQLGLVLAVIAFGVVLLDSGVSVALVRGYNHDTDAERREALVGGVFKAKMLQLLLVALLAVPVAYAVRFFVPEINGVETLAVGIASAGLMSLWTTVRSLEQARQNYASFTTYIYLYGVLRFCAYGVVLIRGNISPISVVSCLYLVPLVLLMLYSFAFRETKVLAIGKVPWRREMKAFKDALLYGAWLAGASILLAFLTRMPVFFLARRSTPTELGLFTAAFTFVNAFGLIWDALSTVIVPEVSGLHTAESRVRFQSLLFRKLPLMGSLLAAVIVACAFAQYFLLGPQYRASIWSFIVLGSFFAVCMCISVNNNLVHAYGIPEVATLMNVARVAVAAMALGLWWHLDALNVAVIYGCVLLVGDTALLIYIQRRVAQDRNSLGLVALQGAES